MMCLATRAASVSDLGRSIGAPPRQTVNKPPERDMIIAFGASYLVAVTQVTMFMYLVL